MNRNEFVSELSKLRPSSMFLALKGYRNEFSEVADYSLLFHMSYENALHRSIDILNEYIPSTDTQVEAKLQLLNSFATSLRKLDEAPEEVRDETYTHFLVDGVPVKGIKLHVSTNNLHLYGLVVHKRVLMPGLYPSHDTRSALTIEKDHLRRMCPVGKFRQFKLLPDRLDSIAVQNLSLLPPG